MRSTSLTAEPPTSTNARKRCNDARLRWQGANGSLPSGIGWRRSGTGSPTIVSCPPTNEKDAQTNARAPPLTGNASACSVPPTGTSGCEPMPLGNRRRSGVKWMSPNDVALRSTQTNSDVTRSSKARPPNSGGLPVRPVDLRRADHRRRRRPRAAGISRCARCDGAVDENDDERPAASDRLTSRGTDQVPPTSKRTVAATIARIRCNAPFLLLTPLPGDKLVIQ